MEAGNSSSNEEIRSFGTGPYTMCNTIITACGSSRQSPKITMPSSLPATAASPSVSSLIHSNSVSPSVPKKIMSKNHNNTIFPTTYPSNLAELQLYRVMQNASLLYYYDTLLEMGGDDVQQLCDAGEEEFLEIMSLVGMASKPLHVRRLQKSLQEWVTNSNKFKIPLVPGDDFELELSSPRISSNHGIYMADNSETLRPSYSPSSVEVCSIPSVASPGLCLSKSRSYSPVESLSCPPSSSSSPGSTGTSVQITPTLLDSQITKLAESAERLSKQLPQFEPKPYSTKKKMSKELELVMSMSEDDPRRMDEIRKYAAIYGRFDCKRRPEKLLTLHEISVNEAAAQICRFVPVLLTRRDELFPLARQVVKDSGCQYSKTQVSSVYLQRFASFEKEGLAETSFSEHSNRSSLEVDGTSTSVSSKRRKTEADGEVEEQSISRQEINSNDLLLARSSLHPLIQLHSKSRQSINRDIMEPSHEMPTDFDETDSHYSCCNSSSPQQFNDQDTESSFTTEHNSKLVEDQSDSCPEDSNKYSPKVIAARGDNIIAVANPALAMSRAIFAADSREPRLIDND